MENEKDNFWLYVGGGIVAVIALVIAFKSMHGEAIPAKAYEETRAQIETQIKNAK